jgi:hypothetical protein
MALEGASVTYTPVTGKIHLPSRDGGAVWPALRWCSI